jgi:hypothetical protein
MLSQSILLGYRNVLLTWHSLAMSTLQTVREWTEKITCMTNIQSHQPIRGTNGLGNDGYDAGYATGAFTLSAEFGGY